MLHLDGQDIERRYLAGESANQIADSLGISVNTVIRRLEARGIDRRGTMQASRMAKGTPDVADATIAEQYRAGESELAISKTFGISRCAVRAALLRENATIRDLRNAALNRASKMTVDERLKLTEAAHAAVRGVPQSEEKVCRTAATRQRTGRITIGEAEKRVNAMLSERGVFAVPQLAIGRYNIDLALTESSIAVEIFGGHWHATGYHATSYRKRLDYLLDQGWMPIVVWVTPTYPLTNRATDYIVSRHEERCLEKTARCHEHVIRGDGRGGPAPESQPKCPTGISGNVR
jgi:hypothetical protein